MPKGIDIRRRTASAQHCVNHADIHSLSAAFWRVAGDDDVIGAGLAIRVMTPHVDADAAPSILQLRQYQFSAVLQSLSQGFEATATKSAEDVKKCLFGEREDAKTFPKPLKPNRYISSFPLIWPPP